MVAKVRKSKASTSSKKSTKKSTTKAKAKAAPKKKAAAKATSTTDVGQALGPHKFKPYQPKKNEEYMNDDQLLHFRKILEAWKREIMEEVDHTITEMKDSVVLADPNDRATQEETFSLELRTRDRERKLLKKIEEALSQIDDKEYGYCETCGIEIGIRRLEARPTASLCIDCKTLDEIREKRTSN